jgi:hypothetical protein
MPECYRVPPATFLHLLARIWPGYRPAHRAGYQPAAGHEGAGRPVIVSKSSA